MIPSLSAALGGLTVTYSFGISADVSSTLMYSCDCLIRWQINSVGTIAATDRRTHSHADQCGRKGGGGRGRPGEHLQTQRLTDRRADRYAETEQTGERTDGRTEKGDREKRTSILSMSRTLSVPIHLLVRDVASLRERWMYSLTHIHTETRL